MPESKNSTINEGKKEDKQKCDICFVIMPFGGWFDEYYREIYCPAIVNADLKPIRTDDLYHPANIVNDIWIWTQKSVIVLADLSEKNSNVYYELGLAHALAKPAILITDSVEQIPFDLRALRVLEYHTKNPNWGGILKNEITKAIKETLQTPLESILPAFLKETKTDQKSMNVSGLKKEFLQIKKEVELIQMEMLRIRSILPSQNLANEYAPAATKVSNMLQLIKDSRDLGMNKKEIFKNLRDLGYPQGDINRALGIMN